MNGQTIIITGGGGGMGSAMAKRFAHAGANIVIAGRSLETLEKAKTDIEHHENQVLCVQMDVRKIEDVNRMVEETLATFGKIDHLVNNAAGNFLVNAEDLSVNGWNAIIDIVLNGTFYCTQAVAKEWIKTGHKGSILNMIATYAWGAAPGIVHSVVAKAGVLGMTRTLAVEWGNKYGIRVNAIAPGPIEGTGSTDRFRGTEDAVAKAKNSVPLKRLGSPNEVAGLAAFMLSEEGSYLNGECITLDGGHHLNTQAFNYFAKK
ncbi:2,4-dienoyl-CoA reductase [Neobacillus niacini]|uniref:2,4-dienoyl-CoA reductase n=1 Tax=Neobacillus niacini TaxID=86668 RepID=UPI002FFF5054